MIASTVERQPDTAPEAEAELTSAELAALARQIGPAAYGPRRHRRFPYRVESPEEAEAVRGDIDRVLRDVEALIALLVHRRLADLPNHEREEVIQDIRVYLWQHSLKFFDTQRGVRLSTFIYKCSDNLCRSHDRTLARRAVHRKQLPIAHAVDVNWTVAPSRVSDRAVERVAEMIQHNPERFLNARQANVIRAMFTHPHMSHRELAERLGYRQSSSFSMMISRIREHLAGLDIEGLAAEVCHAA